MTDQTEWFYAQDDEQRGPVSFQELAQMAADGVLAPDQLVWAEHLDDWQPAETVDELWGVPNWHYAQNDEQQGPVTWVTLRRMARDGTLSRDDLVWHESLPDWIEAARVADLFPKKKSAPPVIKRTESSKSDADDLEPMEIFESADDAKSKSPSKKPNADIEAFKSLGASLLKKAKEAGKKAAEVAVEHGSIAAKKAAEVAAEQGAKAAKKAGEAAKVAGQKAGEAAQAAKKKAEEKLAERRSKKGLAATADDVDADSAPKGSSLLKKLMVGGGVFLAGCLLLGLIGKMFGGRGGSDGVSDVTEAVSEEGANEAQPIAEKDIPGGKQVVDANQFAKADGTDVKAAREHLRSLEKRQRELAGEFTECRVYGEIKDRDNGVLQLYGQAIPTNGDIRAPGTLLENGNIVIVDPDLNAIAGQYYRPSIHFYAQRTFGKNLFGADVPILHYGPAPAPVKAIVAEIKQARQDYGKARKAAVAASLKNVSKKYSTEQGKPLLTALLKQLRTIEDVDGAGLGDLRPVAEQLGIAPMSVGKGGFVFAKPESGVVVATSLNQVVGLTFVVQPELLAKYYPWVEQMKFQKTELALPLDVPATEEVAKAVGWNGSSSWPIRSPEIVDINLSVQSGNPEINDYHLLCLTDGERYSLLAVTAFNSKVASPLLVFGAGNAVHDPLLDDSFSPELGSPRAYEGSLPEMSKEFVTGAKPMQAHSKPVRALASSAKGTRMVSVAEDGKLVLWHAKTGRKIEEWDVGSGAFHAVAYHPNGKSVLIGTEQGDLVHWDIDNGKKIASLKGHSSPVLSVTFNEDGKKAASGSKDKTVRVWDVDGAAELKSLTGSTDGIARVALSKDGGQVVGGGRDGIVRVWDTKTGAEVSKFDSHTAGISGVAISPDQKSVVSGDENGELHVWGLADGQSIRRPSAPRRASSSPSERKKANPIEGVSWPSELPHYLVVYGDETVALFPSTTGTASFVLQELGNKDRPTCSLLANSGKYAFAGNESGLINRWHMPARAAKNKPQLTPIYNDDKHIDNADLAISSLVQMPNGVRLSDGRAMSPDGKVLLQVRDKAFRLLDIDSAKELGKVTIYEGDTVMFSDDLRFFIVHHSHRAPNREAIELWDFAESKLVQSLGKAQFAPRMAVSSGGKFTSAVDSMTGKLIIADRAGKTLNLPGQQVDRVTFLPNGELLVDQNGNQPHLIINPQNPNAVVPLQIEKNRRGGLIPTRDGKRLYQSEREFHLFDIATGQEIGKAELSSKPGSGGMKLALAPDGSRVMHLGRDDVTIIDTNTGRTFRTLKPLVPKGARNSDSYKFQYDDGVFLSNDVVLLTTLSGSAHVWNIDSEKELFSQPSVGKDIIGISNDSRRLITQTSQYGITIWDVPEFK